MSKHYDEKAYQQMQMQLHQANERISNLQENCELLKLELYQKEREVTALNQKISDAVNYVQMCSGLRIFRLVHLQKRIRHQLLSPERQERKAFWRWVRKHLHHVPDTDRQYNPILGVETILKNRSCFVCTNFAACV